jgi:signal transduction histidine kinase
VFIDFTPVPKAEQNYSESVANGYTELNITASAKTDEMSSLSAESGVSDENNTACCPVLSCTKSRDFPVIAAHLDMLYHTLSATNQISEIETLLQQILEQIARWITINQGCILLYDSELQQLIPQTFWNCSGGKEPEQLLRLTMNRSVIEYVINRKEGILTTEKCTEEYTEKYTGECEKNACGQIYGGDQMIREILCIPMLGCYGLVGIIYIDTFPHFVPADTVTAPNLTPDHLRLMILVARQTALAIENTRLHQQAIQTKHLATVGETVSILSHHIKNILQGIDGGSYLVRAGMTNRNESMIQQGWKIVEKNQKRISQLILDMLTLSKEREPDYELGDIAGTIAEVVGLLQFRAKEENVEMTLKAETAIPKFFFDAEQIHHAVANLITNGIDAAKAGNDDNEQNDSASDPVSDPVSNSETDKSIKSANADNANNTDEEVLNDSGKKQQLGLLHIQVDYYREESMVLISVDDNGLGIPETQRGELFRAFYSQKKGRGTGLGLSVARKIILEHGGKIRVTNSPLGGARFEIELPTNTNIKTKS